MLDVGCCLQASDLVNAAAMSQLAAAEEAELSARAALSQQVAAYEALQADKAALAARTQELQVRGSQCLMLGHSMLTVQPPKLNPLSRLQKLPAWLQGWSICPGTGRASELLRPSEAQQHSPAVGCACARLTGIACAWSALLRCHAACRAASTPSCTASLAWRVTRRHWGSTSSAQGRQSPACR